MPLALGPQMKPEILELLCMMTKKSTLTRLRDVGRD